MYSDDGINWVGVSATEKNSWNSVTYGNGKFVAVASTGTNRVMWSPDGITWTAAAAPLDNPYTSVTFGEGRFVAVANGGTMSVMYSTDAINWTAVDSAENNGWYSITYGDGKFVAVAINGDDRIQWSLTGTGATETVSSTSITTSASTSLTDLEGNSTMTDENGNVISYTPQSSTITNVNTVTGTWSDSVVSITGSFQGNFNRGFKNSPSFVEGIGGDSLSTVVFAPYTGNGGFPAPTPTCFSTDGKNFTTSADAVGSNIYARLLYQPQDATGFTNYWIMIGQGNQGSYSGSFRWSDGGNYWFDGPMSPFPENTVSAACGGGQVVVCSFTNGSPIYNTNPKSTSSPWTECTVNPGSQTSASQSQAKTSMSGCRDLVFDNSMFLGFAPAGTDVGGGFYTSTDGKVFDWKSNLPGFPSNGSTNYFPDVSCLAYGSSTGKWVGTIGDNNSYSTKPNNVTWDENTSIVYSSDNAVSWNAVVLKDTNGTSIQLYQVVCGDNGFVALGKPVGSGSEFVIFQSVDGINWIQGDISNINAQGYNYVNGLSFVMGNYYLTGSNASSGDVDVYISASGVGFTQVSLTLQNNQDLKYFLPGDTLMPVLLLR